MNVLVVGGGRWARTYITVLHELFYERVTIYVSANNSKPSLEEHLRHLSISPEPVLVDRDWCLAQSSDFFVFAVIVNRAVDHFNTAMQLIKIGCPVLIEKPMALGAHQVDVLTTRYSEAKVPLYVAHVFLWVQYLKIFADYVRAAGKILAIELVWTDPEGISAGFSNQKYDPGVSIIQDVMPHAFSIISSICAVDRFTCEYIRVEGGGAKVLVIANIGSIALSITLQRNSKARQRLLLVKTEEHTLSLDFTKEPGVIDFGDGHRDSKALQSSWDNSNRPLASMILAMCSVSDRQEVDTRLLCNSANLYARAIDPMILTYTRQRDEWLNDTLRANPQSLGADVIYALDEIVLQENYLSESALLTKREEKLREIQKNKKGMQL